MEAIVSSAGVGKLTYLFKDHLGSIVTEVDAKEGIATQRSYSFTEWGVRRHPNGQALATPAQGLATDRGFTGHEMLDEIGLIHMNGRIYDGAVAMFLSADPLISNPYDLQHYNRYSYVLNNPLSMTDPTGLSPWTEVRRPLMAIAAAVIVHQFAGPYISSMVAQMGFTGEAATLVASAAKAAAAGFASGGIMGGNWSCPVLTDTLT